MEAPKLGQKIDAALVHATATGRVPLDEMSGSLGDGKELSAKVGRYIARAGPMKHTAFATLKPGALSTSHPGLALPAEYAKRTCSTSDWAEYDGTLSQAAEICASTVNFEGLTQRSHVPLAKQWVHGLDQELLQTISDLTYVYRILDDYSGPILPLHRWSMLRRPEGGAVGSYEEGPREGLRALSQRYARALWNEDLTSLRKTPLISEVPLYENSLASDGQWRILMVLGSRHGRLHNGHPNLLDEEGDAYMPELQGDLGTYNTVNGCVERQENAVLRGGFASEEAAAENVKALRMVWAFNQLKPQATTAAHRCAAAPPLSHVPAVSDGSRARVLSLQMHNQMALAGDGARAAGILGLQALARGSALSGEEGALAAAAARLLRLLTAPLPYIRVREVGQQVQARGRWQCVVLFPNLTTHLSSPPLLVSPPAMHHHTWSPSVFAVPRPSRFSPTVAQDGARVQRRRGDGGDEQGSVR
jgi:hypothetical protein